MLFTDSEGQQPLARADKQPLARVKEEMNCLAFIKQSSWSRQCIVWREHIDWSVTIADNAIKAQTRFISQKKRGELTILRMMCWQRCKFHITDCGWRGDKDLFETLLYDRFLRLVRRHFDFGTGDLIHQGVAAKFSAIAKMFEDQQKALAHSVADAEAKLAAEQFAKRAKAFGLQQQPLASCDCRDSLWRHYFAVAIPGDRRRAAKTELRFVLCEKTIM